MSDSMLVYTKGEAAMRMFALCVCLLGVALEAKAEFTMPKKVFRMGEFEKAKAEAESKGQPITFIFTDEHTSCGLCSGASLKTAEKLDKKTVVVYADCNTERPKLPAAVQQALQTPEAGRFIPMTVITDAALTNVLAIVPYVRGDAEQEQLLKDVLKKLPKATPMSAAAHTLAPRPGLPMAGIPPAEGREFRTWKSLSGATIEAALVQERSGRVRLKTRDGSSVEIMVANLAKDDQTYLGTFRNESSNHPVTNAIGVVSKEVRN